MSRSAHTAVREVEADVCLYQGTWIVERGSQHRRYRVKLRGDWHDLSRLPAYVQTARDPDDRQHGSPHFLESPPGCQYCIRYQLSLPVGTEVERIITAPRDVRPTMSSKPLLAWLKYERPPRHTGSTLFRVSRNGSLLPEARWHRRKPKAHVAPRGTAENFELAGHIDAYLKSGD